MTYTLLQLQEMPPATLLELGASTARSILRHWPAELDDHRPSLERAVRVLEKKSGLQPPSAAVDSTGEAAVAPPLQDDVLPLTEEAFLAVKLDPHFNRRAVVVIDVIRAVARAFQTIPAPDPPSLQQEPAADDQRPLHGRLADQAAAPQDPAVEIYDALQLAAELEP